ncbi:tetraacyldisaccharide 4'-kinase [Pasteurella skyensis]|uniref:Tetraacyldisaccharide 4'-kinase n=1 Tax=Phocoenobacter skyensis TaxID=97481 RepID=A0AAJ6P171_9PAST|nr:tetraacyldisaccharide 4'-kinase [Pasteurella skyensis]MDP8161565.1 tetraacyldisaccharide 4'-kinase [Pasteurella skyensis]MDP8173399.1 tetraacyldisaccharide 4'-kinase [Pasteurella skyensis]MDP8175959.1 tetraacyldisaccharide 4'-kinase [Pasteurella skyensis]MDP8177927.1 tetraacyldisaccharide 4'-kinase [Pasteurella skyensis]MDP8182414.1 tetraacyldisaccharide 4'-kinase [Pasteurella skyensis]
MKIWQNRSILTWILSPLSLLFYLISRLRRWLFCKNLLTSYRSPVPVLIVGNISVGGNGKTPLVIWLVEQLEQRGIRVGVISRGYGAKTKDFPQLVTPESSAEQMGDEPVLIVQRTQVPLAISPNRQQSIELLLKNHSLDLIIADDGLQHYKLQRDFEWVVIDGERRFGNGFVLPAGGLRELPNRLKSVNALICNGGKALPNEHQMTLQADYAINVKTNQKIALSDLKSQDIVVMAGIGYPPRFFNMLANFDLNVTACHSFADHQPYSKEQLLPLANHNQILLMTEKDAVKCRHFAQDNWFFVPINATFTQESTKQLLNPILEKLGKNDE